MATPEDKAAFHPQPRTFAPSKEDVLQVRPVARPTNAPFPITVLSCC